MYNYGQVFKYQRKTRMNDGKIDIKKEEGTIPFNVRPQIQSRFNLFKNTFLNMVCINYKVTL